MLLSPSQLGREEQAETTVIPGPHHLTQDLIQTKNQSKDKQAMHLTSVYIYPALVLSTSLHTSWSPDFFFFFSTSASGNQQFALFLQISNKMNQGFLEKWLNLGLGQDAWSS